MSFISPPANPNPNLSSPITSSSLNYWCYVCNVSISLPSDSPFRCPHCMQEFLSDRPSSSPRPPPSFFDFRSRSSSSSSSSPSPPSSPSSSDDDIPTPIRRIHVSINSHDLPTAPFGIAPGFTVDSLTPIRPASILSGHHLTTIRCGPPPASISAINSIPTIKISEPSDSCPVCMDDFPLNSSARQLPCSHVYHSDCIISWLKLHNSCPVCRAQIPSSEHGQKESPGTDRLPFETVSNEGERTVIRGRNNEGGRRVFRVTNNEGRRRVVSVTNNEGRRAVRVTNNEGGRRIIRVTRSRLREIRGEVEVRGVSNGFDEDGDTVMSDARD